MRRYALVDRAGGRGGDHRRQIVDVDRDGLGAEVARGVAGLDVEAVGRLGLEVRGVVDGNGAGGGVDGESGGVGAGQRIVHSPARGIGGHRGVDHRVRRHALVDRAGGRGGDYRWQVADVDGDTARDIVNAVGGCYDEVIFVAVQAVGGLEIWRGLERDRAGCGIDVEQVVV